MHSFFPQRARLALLTAILIGGIFVFPRGAGAIYGDTTTFVGRPYDGDGGQATSALLDFPDDVASDADGNFYIADTYDNAIRKVDANGVITTLTGGSYGLTDGTGAAAEFALPRGVAVDASGTVYVADTDNDAIRKITAAGVVTTLISTGLSDPYGVAVAGSTLFIADTGNDALKSVPTSGGLLTTITASLNGPRKIVTKADGSAVYVADTDSFRVLKVDVATGVVTVVAGSGTYGYAEGTGAIAQFQYLWGIALSNNEGTLYVSDHDQYLTDRIRTINLSTGATSLLTSDTAQQVMIFPSGMTVHGGQLYVAMSGLGIVRRFTINNPSSTSILAGSDRFGSREGADPLFGRPHDLALSTDRRTLYLADNNRIRKIDIATKTATYITGSIVDNYRDGLPIGNGVSVDQEARFSTIAGIVVNRAQTALYVTDRWNNRIRKIDLTTSPVSVSLVTGAGRINSTGETENGYQEGGPCTQVVDRNDALTVQSGCAYFQRPTGLVLDPDEQYLYVADTGNQRIRKVRLSDGQTSLVAGSTQGYTNATGSEARFSTPWGLALNDNGTLLYVADRSNHRIRTINLQTNEVTSLAGAGSAGYQEGIGEKVFFSSPQYLKRGADGKLYLSESGSHRIRQVDPATGLSKLVSGSGNRGYVNGAMAVAEFNNPEGIAPDTTGGTLYAVDSWNDTIRQVNVEGVAPYADPAPTVTEVVPQEVARNWATATGLRVKILGTGFRFGATTKLYTTPAIKTYVLSSTELVVTLPINTMKAGWYDVTVTNVDGQFGVLETGLGLREATGPVPEQYFTAGESKGFLALPSTFRLGLVVATGDVWGDSRDEIIAGTGAGAGPQVSVFSQDGTLRGRFFAYGKTTTTGVRVAACDMSGDGIDEIITVPGKGAKPLIKIFNLSGKEVLPSFYALDGKFLGGANIACGDVNADGNSELIVSASRGGGPHVTIHRSSGKIIGNFFAYDKKFRGGIHVNLLDLDGNSTPEIVTGPEVGAPHVQIFSGSGRRLSPGFFAFVPSFRGGINVAGGDTNDDGRDEIVVTPASSAQALVKIYNTNGNIIYNQFFAFPRTFTSGARLAVGDVDGDGVADIIAVPEKNYAPSVRMFHQNGVPL